MFNLREMDYSIQRLLNDKIYDKRKQGALEYGRPLGKTTEGMLIRNLQT